MIRKYLLTAILSVCLSAVPFVAKADEMQRRTGFSSPAQEAEALSEENQAEKTTKYAAEGAQIYKEPAKESEILGVSLKNTSFEVVGEKDGFCLVTTAAGVAYIESGLLFDTPLPAFAYTDEDLYILAHTLAGECQNCPDQEQLYVGSVVLNRVLHPSFPGTIKGVVFQRGQYACTRDGNYYREPTGRNWANAKWLLENGSVLPANVIWQSGRKQGKGIYIKTRYHYYCY